MNVIEAIKSRRTVRKFKNIEIPYQTVVELIDCARYSPSAANIQSLKYLIVTDSYKRKNMFPYIKYAGYIKDWGVKFSESPMAFIAVLNDTNIRITNSLCEIDCGISLMSISLVAYEKGIGSCIIGALDRQKIKDILNINKELELMYLIGLGYPDQKNSSYDEDRNIKYSLDEDGNFIVPKRKLESIIV